MIGGGSLGLSAWLSDEFSVLVQGSRFDTFDEEFDSNNLAFLTNPPVFFTLHFVSKCYKTRYFIYFLF